MDENSLIDALLKLADEYMSEEDIADICQRLLVGRKKDRDMFVRALDIQDRMVDTLEHNDLSGYRDLLTEWEDLFVEEDEE